MIRLPSEAVGAVVAALVAGVLSLIGLIISKEQKISEFRQVWIDALRSDVADVIAHLIAIRALKKESTGNQIPFRITRDHWIVINAGITRILLRLNPHEDRGEKLVQSLRDVEKLFQQGEVGTSERIMPAIEDLISVCGELLKQEWNRVKRGEKTYRFARTSAIIAAVLAAAILTMSSLRTHVEAAKDSNASRDESQHISYTISTAACDRPCVRKCGRKRTSSRSKNLPCRTASTEPSVVQ